MECKLIQYIELSSKPAGGNLLLGEIVQFHADKDIYILNSMPSEININSIIIISLCS